MHDIAPDIGVGHSLHGRWAPGNVPEPCECEACCDSLAYGEPCPDHEPEKHAAHLRWCRRQEIRDRTWNALRVAWAMAEGRPLYDNGYGRGLTADAPIACEDIPF